MTEFNNITDLQVIKLLFYITSAVLVISVGIIGYFLSRRDNAMITRDNAITAASENLITAVQQLKTVVNSLQLQHEIRQPLIDAQLELFRKAFLDNADTVNKIDTRLIKLETEHKLFHCHYPINKCKTKKNDIAD